MSERSDSAAARQTPGTRTPASPEAAPKTAAPEDVVATVEMTGHELGALLGALQLHPAAHSPLAGVTLRAPRITATQRDALVTGGWMTEQGQMTPLGTQTLQAVARPGAEVAMILGTPSSLLTTAAYVADTGLEPGSLVFLNVEETSDGSLYRFQPGRDPRVISESLRDQVLVGPVKAPASLRAELTPAGFLALLGTLDWRLHSLLAARLDREGDPAATLGASEVWEMVVEGRAAGDLAWGVTLFSVLMPFLPWNLDEAGLDAGLAELDRARLTTPEADGRHTFLWKLQALADALFPIVAFGSVTATRWDERGDAGRSVLALIRGRAAMVMVQAGGGADGAATIGVDVLDDVETAEVLIQMAQRPEMVLPPTPTTLVEPAELVCPSCGQSAPPDSRFCRHCGSPLA